MKLAILCSGKTQLGNEDPLEYISNSLDDVSNVLNNNNWKVIPHFTATTEQNFNNTINNYISRESLDGIKEILFYYSGHGIYSDSYSKSVFRMVWQEHKQPVSSVISSLNEIFNSIHNKIKLSLIIDSCYSGDAIIAREPDRCIEILTSTSDGKKTYEQVIDGRGRSIFSYCFCQVFQTPSEKNVITLRDIKSLISNSENTLKCTMTPYYSEPLESDLMVIGYSKEINELLDYFKTHYSNNIEDFKKDILSYLKTRTTSFPKVMKLDNFKDLFKEILEVEECLYCVLKQLDNSHEYLDKLKIVENCEELKKEVLKSRTISAIILVIKTDTGDDIGSCILEGYLECIDGTFFNSRTLTKINFKTDSYKKDLSNYLSELLETIYNSEDVLELKLILSDSLFEINFYDLEVEERSPLPIPRNIIEKFNITTKLFLRFENYNKKGFFEKWEKNIQKCKQLESQRVTTHLCSIKNRKDITSMDKIFLDGDTSTGTCIDYIALISDYSLKAQKNLYIIISGGLPIVLYPQLKEEENVQIVWLNTSVKDIKATAFQHITKQRNIHFMHDTYDEAESLQTAINTNQIKDYK